MSQRLSSARRIVIKIGSALLVDGATGTVHRRWLEALAADIAALHGKGCEVVITTSGAIALGRRRLGLGSGALRLEEKQAAAASGQIHLAHAYQEVLAPHGMMAAQILLTAADTEERRRYLNARSTITTLLRLGAVPVINENDTVATEEIRFGDNDRLAARVAQMVSAEVLVLLSDIDGLYTADPHGDPGAVHVPEVARLTPEIERMAGPPRAGDGSGGMVTKLSAARIATAAGCHMVLAAGTGANPIAAILNGARCTWFLASTTPRTARKHWIAGTLKPKGSVTLDAGACRALGAGKSVLPAGVTRVEGRFDRGDAVALCDASGREVGRGLIAYAAADAARIAGHKSREIEALLGYRGRDELIHRDDLVLAEGPREEAGE
ncbi:MAG: glutamate 5-kinase [Alphaproteobacteria bacterium]|nr:glutamate 5-kinase [Alphaproteobacteria bacterium]